MRRVLGMLTILGVVVAAAVLHLRDGLGVGDVERSFAPLLHIDPRILCLIVSLDLLSLLLAGALWTRLARALGYRLPFRLGLAAYLSATLGGYLLSFAGPAVGCALAVRRCGLPAGRAVLLSTLAGALGFCGLLVWTPVGLLALGRSGITDQLPAVHGHGALAGALVLGALMLGMLVVLRAVASAPRARNRLVRRLLGSDSSVAWPALGTAQLVALVPWAAATWLAGALELYAGLAAINPVAARQPLMIVGAAALASTLGSLAFFVPRGLGVKDGALVALLAHAAGLQVAQAVAMVLALRLLDPATKLGLLLGQGAIARARRPARRSKASRRARTGAPTAASGRYCTSLASYAGDPARTGVPAGHPLARTAAQSWRAPRHSVGRRWGWSIASATGRACAGRGRCRDTPGKRGAGPPHLAGVPPVVPPRSSGWEAAGRLPAPGAMYRQTQRGLDSEGLGWAGLAAPNRGCGAVVH